MPDAEIVRDTRLIEEQPPDAGLYQSHGETAVRNGPVEGNVRVGIDRNRACGRTQNRTARKAQGLAKATATAGDLNGAVAVGRFHIQRKAGVHLQAAQLIRGGAITLEIDAGAAA